MGKITVQIPLITWRNGRPRFSPGPRLRKSPFSMKGEDLRHGPDGAWFTLPEAMAWSEQRQALIASIAGATPKQARAIKRSAAGDTVGQLFERWFQEPRMNGKAVQEGRKHRRPLAANTVANYKKAAKRIEHLDDGRIWHAPAAATTATVWAGVFDKLEIKHGLSSTRNSRAGVSALFTWAIGAGRFKGTHPIKAIDGTMPVPEARTRYGSPDEIAHFIACADLIGRPEIGDSIALGVWTGQRQNDRLALTDAQDTPEGMLMRQNKKGGQPLLIPPAPQLKARLNAARTRRKGWKVDYPFLVVDERARAPFKRDWYVHTFARVRAFAASGEGRHELTGEAVTCTPMPSLTAPNLRDQDLRDTAVTWLALAGCTIPQIASITGHSLKTIETVLKHYLGMHPELARTAIGKLVAWHDSQGEAK